MLLQVALQVLWLLGGGSILAGEVTMLDDGELLALGLAMGDVDQEEVILDGVYILAVVDDSGQEVVDVFGLSLGHDLSGVLGDLCEHPVPLQGLTLVTHHIHFGSHFMLVHLASLEHHCDELTHGIPRRVSILELLLEFSSLPDVLAVHECVVVDVRVDPADPLQSE